MKYAVYILYSKKTDKYYIGQTNNLARRIKEHNDDRECKSSFTKKYQPWELVCNESFDSRVEAIKLEKYLKSLKNRERLKQYIAGWRSSTSRGS